MSFYRASDIKARSQGPEVSLGCIFILDGGIQCSAGLGSFPGLTSARAALFCPVYYWREIQNICSSTQCC